MSESDVVNAMWTLWGKTTRSSSVGAGAPDEGTSEPEWHPLVCHLLDVMWVADEMLERIPKAAVRVLTQPFGDEAVARAWLRLLIGLHDAGKATPGFQGKWRGNEALQQAHGLVPSRPECHPHGITGTALLTQWLGDAEHFGDAAVGSGVARALARTVASHHGVFADDMQVSDCEDEHFPRFLAPPWTNVHHEIVRVVVRLAIEGTALRRAPGDVDRNPGFLLALAGLTSVADWIGSNGAFFRFAATPVDVDVYSRNARTTARAALDDLGWRRCPPAASRTFGDLFPFPPRALQQVGIDVARSLLEPTLVVAESTMGDGKTELALYLAEVLRHNVGAEGLFIGLPTQATANQMLGRVEDFLRRTETGRVNLQLVHGDAALDERGSTLRLRAIYGEDAATDGAVVAAENWFWQSKRALLATYAVGTVDQGLLGVLKTRHGFVRLFGLAGKTVVLDEVHAYDTYTSELLDRMVSWLGVLGTSVIILSATLPSRRRRQLLEAYGANPPSAEAPYPRVTVAHRKGVARSIGCTASRASQGIDLERIADDRTAIVRNLAEAIRDRGCVAWINNTVERAQRAYLALEQARAEGTLPVDTDIELLHSRLLRGDRNGRERTAASKFGPEGVRPSRAILVGTQVLEQSLDFDFDLMVSDLAPVDLLLQRAGRLHRHGGRRRPAALSNPKLVLVEPEQQDGVPDLRRVAPSRVYDESVMLRTWWALHSATRLTVPDELETWIERVYGDLGARPGAGPLLDRLTEAEENQRDTQLRDWQSAQARLLFDPRAGEEKDRLGAQRADYEEDEDGTVPSSLRAMTRLGEPATDVVCLWAREGRLLLERDGEGIVDLDATPPMDRVRDLLMHSVKVDNWCLETCPDVLEPKGWQKSPALRYRKALRFDRQGSAPGIVLHPRLGLVFGTLAKEVLSGNV